MRQLSNSIRACSVARCDGKSVATVVRSIGGPTLRTARAAFSTVKVEVDGVPVEVPAGTTVMSACEEAGASIPRFCYHDRLSIAGNCRMCLVEVERSPKPVASCAMPVMAGMKIKTNSPLVKKAREGVMEFLLSNHPLDCPICDQGGECDLQDQSMEFGSDRSRFREYKRGVEDKNIGPLVKTVMTRCIQCTRCVRYAAEIAGVPTLGTTGRGNVMEIGTYVEKVFDSEISGNSIDLCPVGALTSKPYAFRARPWELTSTESIDVTDAVGANIRIDNRGAEIMRMVPRLHEDVNEEWLHDKGRFSYDGLKRQRLDTPLIRRGEEFVEVSWADALVAVSNAIKEVKPNQVMALAGDLADAESIVALKDLLNRLGSTNTRPAQNTQLSADLRSDYVLNSNIAGIEEADVIVLVGTNPRMEAPLIAARIRKMVRSALTPVYLIGPECDLALPYTHLGNNSQILKDIADGKHKVSAALKNAKKPMVIVGQGAFLPEMAANTGATLEALKSAVPNLSTPAWNGVNILHNSASRVAIQDLGFVPGPDASSPAEAKFVYLLNADGENMPVPRNAFVVYQGHHGDIGANLANIILPGVAYTEKVGTYVNTEGRVQRTNAASGPINSAREDWKIIRALSEVLGVALPYNSQVQIRHRLADVSPTFSAVDTVEKTTITEGVTPAAGSVQGPYSPIIENYWMTDPISRNSKVMAKASATLPTARNSYKHKQAHHESASASTQQPSEKRSYA